jgi:hypothetical protein
MENKDKIIQLKEVLSMFDSSEIGNIFPAKKSSTQSDDIKDLVAALSKAQGAMRPAVFNRVNPHFKNRYADFTSCMDCCREPLANNGLSVMQYCETVNEKLMLVTMLAHVSGQWMKSYFPLNPLKMDSQSIGSAMTYGKRYSLSAMLGIVSDDEDDDGEAAQGREPVQASTTYISKHQKIPSSPKISAIEVEKLKKLDEKLDEECRSKLFAWLKNQYKIYSFEAISVDVYPKVLGSFENAVKFLEQQSQEKTATV